jgi:hypothetical protein
VTELLEHVMAKLKVLPADEQDAIASHFLAELENEKAGNVRFIDNPDPLAKLKQSKFIGCFDGEPNLATNSERF